MDGEALCNGSRPMSAAPKGTPAAWAVVVFVLSASILLPPLFHASSLVQVRLLSAVVPALLVLHLFIRSDLFPEPPQVILVTFVLGIVVTVPVAMIALTVDALAGGFDSWGPLAAPVLRAFVGAAVPEETAKFLILTRYCARHSAFDEPMDGLVYGVTASLGFAALENVLYVLNEPAYPAWVEIASLRAFSAVPSHAVDGAVMGFFVGLAHALPGRRRHLMRAAWGMPVALHGIYDLGALAGIPIIWAAVYMAQFGIARHMLAKLRSIQDGKDHAEAVVAWVWITARRQLWLRPRDLPPAAVATRQSVAGNVAGEDDPNRAPAEPAAAVPTCPRCSSVIAACICTTGAE